MARKTGRSAKSETDTTPYLKPSQVEQIRNAARRGRHGDHDDAIVMNLYDIGHRCGELAQVNVDMLDLDAGELRALGVIRCKRLHIPTQRRLADALR